MRRLGSLACLSFALVSVLSTSAARADDRAWQFRRSHAIDHIEFSPSGSQILTVAAAGVMPGSITLYDRTQQRIIYRRSFPDLAMAQFTADGTGLWVGLSNGVFRFDLGTRALTNDRFSEDSQVRGFFRYHPQSDRMVVRSMVDGLFEVHRRTARIARLSTVGDLETSVDTTKWSPDGRWLAVDGHLFRTSDWRDVRSGLDGMAEFSSDGQQLAVVTRGGGVLILRLDDPQGVGRRYGFSEQINLPGGNTIYRYSWIFGVAWNAAGTRLVLTGRSIEARSADDSGTIQATIHYLDTERMVPRRRVDTALLETPDIYADELNCAFFGVVRAVPGTANSFVLAQPVSTLDTSRNGTMGAVTGYLMRQLVGFNPSSGRIVPFEPASNLDSFVPFVPRTADRQESKIVGISSATVADRFVSAPATSRMIELDWTTGASMPTGNFERMPGQVSFENVTRTDVNASGTLGAYGGITFRGQRTFEIVDLAGRRFNATRPEHGFGNRAVFVSETDAVTESAVSQPPVQMIRYRYDAATNTTVRVGSSPAGDYQVLAKGFADGQVIYRRGARVGVGTITGENTMVVHHETTDFLDLARLSDTSEYPTEYPVAAVVSSATRFRTAAYVSEGQRTQYLMSEWDTSLSPPRRTDEGYVAFDVNPVGLQGTSVFSPDGTTMFTSYAARMPDGSLGGEHLILRFSSNGNNLIESWRNEDGGLPRQAFFAPDGRTVLLHRRDASVIALSKPLSEFRDRTMSAQSVTASRPVQVTIRFRDRAGSGGTRLRMQWVNPFLRMPAEIYIPEGQRSATFMMTVEGTVDMSRLSTVNVRSGYDLVETFRIFVTND
ncbi:MAG: hypothetical protein SFX74_04585 [Fimbriimonadaceae bacterium]|nr:hypothetical protein [Fimbriimonadaceae bacterium]